MISIVNRGVELPDKRVPLYEECAKLLLSKWQSELATAPYMSRTSGEIANFRYSDKCGLLRDLAYQMQDESKPLGLITQEQHLQNLICGHVNKMEINHQQCSSTTMAQEIIAQLHERNCILSFLGGTSYSFVHRTFLEYFCASYYYEHWVKRKLAPEQLQDLFQRRGKDFSWHEVLVILSGMIPSDHMEPCLNVLLELGRVRLTVQCIGQLQNRHDAETTNTNEKNALNRCRHFLINVVQSDDLFKSSDAIRSLATHWKDEATHTLLIEIAQSDKQAASDAVDSLATHWDDEATHKLLIDVREVFGTNNLLLGTSFLSEKMTFFVCHSSVTHRAWFLIQSTIKSCHIPIIGEQSCIWRLF